MDLQRLEEGRKTVALDSSHIARARRSLQMTRDEAMRRIRSDYFELPGLRLTVAQAARLWGLEAALCLSILEELTERGLLTRIGELYGMR
ncbi:MAG TPA: hypothetical protein VH740_18445 [Vicinamibacterales bacterium]|jgi:hypothetical protein